MKKKIFFFGNTGGTQTVPRGGGEIGNRKTISILRNAGYEVVVIEKFKKVLDLDWKKKIYKGILLIANIVEFLSQIILGKRRGVIVHIVGFYGDIIYFEFILVLLAKFCGYRVVYEMRGGGADRYYNSNGLLYRKIFNAVIRISDCVFSQGKENKLLIDKISPQKPFFYYPNYIELNFLPSSLKAKANDELHLLFFGRITYSKNIDVIIKIFESLRLQVPVVKLRIIGNGLPQCIQMVETAVRKYNSDCKYYKGLTREELKCHLEWANFYLFPSTEEHEGHSNALTEAMSWGVIPIASSQGYNRTVVGDDFFIIDELNVNEYVKKIMKIWENGSIDRYSTYMYNRVQQNYLMTTIQIQLVEYYKYLYSIYYNE